MIRTLIQLLNTYEVRFEPVGDGTSDRFKGQKEEITDLVETVRLGSVSWYGSHPISHPILTDNR